MGAISTFTKEAEVATIPIGIIVKKGSTDDVVIPATADTDVAFGINVLGNFNDESKIGQEVSIGFSGRAQVLAGASVNTGDLITSDGAGKAIPLAGSTKTVSIIGMAIADAATDTLFEVAVNVHRLNIP